MQMRNPEDYDSTNPAYWALVQKYGAAELFHDFSDDACTVYGPEDDEVVVLPIKR